MYPRIKARLIEPGALVLSVSIVPTADSKPVLLLENEVVANIQEAHVVIGQFAEEHGIPAECVDIDAQI